MLRQKKRYFGRSATEKATLKGRLRLGLLTHRFSVKRLLHRKGKKSRKKRGQNTNFSLKPYKS
jgi:hypothetical protein